MMVSGNEHGEGSEKPTEAAAAEPGAETPTVKVTVNGKEYLVAAGSTIKDLVCKRLKNKVNTIVNDALGNNLPIDTKIESAMELTATPPAASS